MRSASVVTVETLDIVGVFRYDLFHHIGYHVLLELHNIAEGVDIRKFKVKSRKFGGVLARVRFFGTEYRRDLKNALKARSHCHLLIELRRLGKVCVAVKIVELEHLGAALTRRAYDLGRVELKKVMIEQELTHCGDHVCLKLEYEGVALGAQIDPAVIKA